MNIPPRSSISENICLILMRNTSKTRTEISQLMNKTSRMGIDRNLNLLVDAGLVLQQGRRFFLCDELRAHYEKASLVPEVVMDTKFKPWSGKYSIANAVRREPIREVGFINGSSGFAPTNYA
jgi:hypothetical protein